MMLALFVSCIWSQLTTNKPPNLVTSALILDSININTRSTSIWTSPSLVSNTISTTIRSSSTTNTSGHTISSTTNTQMPSTNESPSLKSFSSNQNLNKSPIPILASQTLIEISTFSPVLATIGTATQTPLQTSLLSSRLSSMKSPIPTSTVFTAIIYRVEPSGQRATVTPNVEPFAVNGSTVIRGKNLRNIFIIITLLCLWIGFGFH